MIWGGRQRNSKDYIFLQRVAGTFPRRTGALPSNFGNGSQRKRWNGQVTLWTMNTWAAAHQNAAVFMRNLGPLVRALRKVMRRKKRAVVIHTVGKRKRRVDRDPGILTCCYSRTQAPGFP
uniref:E3 ubiquitin-protein ligase PPP1R11 isoform X4 n=1 Tax=Callithrix jacchus TaxID=9483 RepID=UPI00159D5554|nr:E3 ubiquitin-protein ligase PPP1R11 isoform X4 [Callithrix jacchus]